MSFQEFLAEQTGEGKFDSEGAFTIDFVDAAERLAAFRLPSESHYLLKVVQLASRLGASVVRIKLESSRTSIHFRAASADGVNDSEAIIRAFLSPLDVEHPVLADLAAALWGAIGESTDEILWSLTQRYKGRRVFIKNRQFRVEDYQVETPIEDGALPCAFTLSVLHHRTWKFWLNSRRNAEAYRLLVEKCGFSRTTLFVDGRELERTESSFYTQHRARPSVYATVTPRQPYQIAMYEIASVAGFAIPRPSLAQYVVRESHVNIWASATRLGNRLVPDGRSSPAWLLQFWQGGQSVGMRMVPKIALCRLVLAHDPSDKTPLRLTLVRQSVLMNSPRLEALDGLLAWRGCHLILDDDTLATDLTGFQVIEDDRLVALLKSLEPAIPRTVSYLEEHQHLVVGL